MEQKAIGPCCRRSRRNSAAQRSPRLAAVAAIVAFLGVLSGGCVTPAAVKDASTKHGNNLTGIQQAVGEYRRQLDAYYDRLVRQQREAHIAWHVDEQIKTIADKQSASIAREIRDHPDSERAAEDFITAGGGLTGAFEFWGRNFDRWVEETPGDSLQARRKSLRDLADKLQAELAAKGQLDASARKRIERLRQEAARSEDELTYIGVAIELKKQRALLDAQLDVLAAQITTMQAFHAKIDEFLSIDATIDGGKIAEAAAAGSKADTTGIFRKK